MTDQLLVPRELLERALKANAAAGRNAIDLSDGWIALDELRALLAQAADCEPKPVEDDECTHEFVMFQSSCTKCGEPFARAQPASEPKPVARIVRPGPRFKGICEFEQARTYAEYPKKAVEESNGYWIEGEPLFTHPAPAGVVLPERKEHKSHGLTAEDTEADGWNACREETARLNGVKP